MYGIHLGDGGGLLWLAILAAAFLFGMILWVASSGGQAPRRTSSRDIPTSHDRQEV
jgi:hypothetical protein